MTLIVSNFVNKKKRKWMKIYFLPYFNHCKTTITNIVTLHLHWFKITEDGTCKKSKCAKMSCDNKNLKTCCLFNILFHKTADFCALSIAVYYIERNQFKGISKC